MNSAAPLEEQKDAVTKNKVVPFLKKKTVGRKNDPNSGEKTQKWP